MRRILSIKMMLFMRRMMIMMITMILRQSGGDQISKPLFFSKFVLLPNVFTLSQCSKCGDVPCGQPCVSGNPSAIMLFYRAVRGGCLETAALSCPDNISLCVVHHTPTYLSLGQIALPELENFERLHICSFWILGLLAFWA